MNTPQTEQEQKLKEFLETQNTNFTAFDFGFDTLIDKEIEDTEITLATLKSRKENQDKVVAESDKCFILGEGKINKEKETFYWYIPQMKSIWIIDVRLRLFFNKEKELGSQILIGFMQPSFNGIQFSFNLKEYMETFSSAKDRYSLKSMIASHGYLDLNSHETPEIDLKKFSDQEREKLFCLPQVRLAIKELEL